MSLVTNNLKVAQLCPTLCDPMNYTVHGILQVRILEWVAVAFSRGSSQPRNQTQISCIAIGFFISEPPGKPKSLSMIVKRNQICNSVKRRGIGSRSYEFISCFLCSKYLCLEQLISLLYTWIDIMQFTQQYFKCLFMHLTLFKGTIIYIKQWSLSL